MAEKISIEVELKSQLEELAKLNTSDLKLNKRQKEAFEINKRGAEQALKNNDWKEFRQYFNNMADILKKASIASGQISKNLQELDKRQSEINKKIQSLKETRDSLEKTITTSKGKGTLSKEAAKNLLKEYKDKDKIIGKGKDPLQDPAVINQRVQKLAADLEKAGKTWSQLTNEMAQAAGFKDKNAAHAAHRFYDSEQAYITKTQGKITNIDEQIKTEEANAASVSAEIQKIQQEAPDAATALEKLYAAISKLKDEVNTKITNVQSDKRKAEAATQGGVDIDTKPLTEGINKQSSALGRAFKQFTLYNIAVRAAKTALREAVQTVKELDKYLTEQAMVTGMTREQTYGLVKEYQNLALQCGATTKEIAEVSTEYMKQGKTIKDSLILTEAAVKAAKVARVSVGDSVNYLTTALNGFQLSAEDAMKVSDKFAAVAAASATDYDELAIALSKVASQANLAGMSIDYTTALLTKGLETTREAPETMGTALKTIIARMRELSDYGETLEGDTNINNVESQLAYVGIALRDTNGELRSTEEVLDELGKKWDTLNKNQQAALAKALAGTRQQSRLIALMDDYERVTELQEISQRSAGATAAQADTYLQGIEASLNKIQVAWEKIIMTVSDSEVIIGIFDFIGNSLDKIGDFLSTDFGLISTLTIVGILTAAALGNKLNEIKLSRLQQKYNLQEQKALNLKNITEQKGIVLNKQKAKDKAKEVLQQIKENKALIAELKIEREIKKARGESTAAIDSGITFLEAQMTMSEEQAQQEYDTAAEALKQEEAKLGFYQQQNTILQSQESLVSGIFTGLSSLTAPLFLVISLWKTISGLITVVSTKQRAHHRKTMSEALAENSINATTAAGKIISNLGVWGIPIAIAVVAALAGVGLAISAAVSSSKKKTADGAADAVNELSNEIYKLNEKAVAISKITESFDKLDNKLIKTKKDLEEINSLLEKGSETMDTTSVDKNEDIGFGKGTNEQQWYNTLDDSGKRLYLDRKQEQLQRELEASRNEQISLIKNLDSAQRALLLDDSSSDAKIIQVQAAIYSLNNAELYKQIDLLKENTDITDDAAQATESLTQSLLEGLSAKEAWDYAQNPDKITKIINEVSKLKLEVQNVNGKMVELSSAEVLNSEDYSLKERVKAFRQIREELQLLGDATMIDSFNKEFSGFDTFARMGDNVLNFIDSVGLSVDDINKLWGSWEALQKNGVQITQEVWENRFDEYMEMLAATQGDVLSATRMVFGDFLDGSEETLNAFISAYGDLVQVGILNMGQNMDKLQNSINSFYEKAMNWAEMTETERAEFLQDNADLFSGEGGEKLLVAFESGNYNDIEEALKNNDALQKQIEQRKKEVEQELLIEEARKGEDRNEAYIAELKRYEKYLNDTENMFKASLEVRLEQERKQLDEYKSYLQDQQKALEDSLNKRKDAYQSYFDSINQNEEDEDYEEESNMLIDNISKLGSTNNASAQQKTKELEQQLEELEQERLKELRERAQEAILENMDDELAEISEKFDKLLDSNQALLLAMQGDLDDPSKFLTDMITNKISDGATELDMASYVDELKGTYGSVLGDKVDWDILKETINQLFLNVNGQTINLTQEEESNVYNIIMNAITQVGRR